jgi:hypothetical protein
MIVRPWSRTALKIVIMAATMCSGVAVMRYDWLEGDKGKSKTQDRHASEQAMKISSMTISKGL